MMKLLVFTLCMLSVVYSQDENSSDDFYTVCHDGLTEWSEWSDYGMCVGVCGKGTETSTRTRDCCAASGCLDAAGHALSESQTQSCDVVNVDLSKRKCRNKLLEMVRYDSYVCDESKYLGTAYSAGECQDQYDGVDYSKNGFLLECKTDNDAAVVASGCWACTSRTLVHSSCGTRTFLEADHSWNWAIFIIGLLLAILVSVGLAVMTAKEIDICSMLCGTSSDDDRSKMRTINLDDELQVEMNLDEPMFSWCPAWFSLAGGTMVMCLIGFALGALLNIGLEDVSAQQKSDVLELIYYPGELWILLLKLVVVPLIALMMVTLPDRVRIAESDIGVKLLMFYVCTSFLAACEGVMWVNIVQPGNATLYIMPPTKAGSDGITELDSLLGIGRKLIYGNITDAMASNQILCIIFFWLTAGIFIQSDSVKEEWRRVIINGCKACLKSCMLVIPYIIKITPIAMISIVTSKVAGIDNLQMMLETESLYLLTVILTHGIHGMVFYPCLLMFGLPFFGGKSVNGWAYFNSVRQAPLTAFACSSSAATLPVTLETLKDGNCSNEVADFIAPLGSAINMDGTAGGFPIIVIFTAQLLDIELAAGDQILLILLAMTCSVGTAPIPNAGVVYISMLFSAMGGEMALDSTLSLGLTMFMVLDWFVDRVETAQNVWSDCVASKFFDSLGYGESLAQMNKQELEDIETPQSKEEVEVSAGTEDAQFASAE